MSGFMVGRGARAQCKDANAQRRTDAGTKGRGGKEDIADRYVSTSSVISPETRNPYPQPSPQTALVRGPKPGTDVELTILPTRSDNRIQGLPAGGAKVWRQIQP